MRAVCLLVLSLCAATTCFAKDPTAAQLEFFEKKIRPVLAAHCYQCHGPDKQEGALRLDSRAALLAGGDTGEAIVPGKPQESLLIEAILYGDDGYQMPPSGKLPAEIIKNLTTWVKDGVPWPKEAAPSTIKNENFDLQGRAKHWSFLPIQQTQPPAVKEPQWPLVDVDRFILAKLESQGLSPVKSASRRVLIRRLYFALIGLPPTPQEVQAFLDDKSPQAVETVVDRLLASPHFGERWGRHWLDLVRYAESHGHEFDYPIHHAWRYRDYVIRALNADVPYNDFVREQIAGDLLDHPRSHPTEGYNESILGTGFWLLGEATHSPVDVRGDEAGRIDNQIDVMTKTFLGVTVACARCHDHKFDPISTRDYYALAGFLQSSRRQEALLDPHGKIATAVEKLSALRKQADELLASAIPQSNQATAESFSSYLRAALEICHREPQPTIDQFAQEHGLAPAQLQKWVATLKNLEKDSTAQSLTTLKSLFKHYKNPAATVQNELSEQAKAAAKNLAATMLFADFNGDDFGDWFVSGQAFGDGPTRVEQWDVSTLAACPVSWNCLHSGRLAPYRKASCVRRHSEITGNRIFYRMAGRGGMIRLIIDGYYMDEFSGLLFNGMKFKVDTDGRFVWHTQEVGKYLGHKAYIEIIDHGDGFVAVDEVRFANATPQPLDAPDPLLLEILRKDPQLSMNSIAAALGTRWTKALDRWHAGEADAADQRLLAWVLANQLLESSQDSVEKLTQIDARIRQLGETIPSPLHVLAMTAGSPEDERVHIRGSHKKLGEVVPRRFLEVLAGPEQPAIPDACGRLELAEQIVVPTNPLTSRVIVNRVWHHLFGRGIVASVDNFGVLGQAPSHPELLDSLATEFMNDGWSLKPLNPGIGAVADFSNVEPCYRSCCGTSGPGESLVTPHANSAAGGGSNSRRHLKRIGQTGSQTLRQQHSRAPDFVYGGARPAQGKRPCGRRRTAESVHSRESKFPLTADAGLRHPRPVQHSGTSYKFQRTGAGFDPDERSVRQTTGPALGTTRNRIPVRSP